MPKTERETDRLAKKNSYVKQNRFYNKAYRTGDTPWTSEGKPAPELVNVIRKLKRGLRLKRALDLGSGEGRHSIFLQKQGFKVIGLEYQKEAIERSMGRGLKNLIYVRADLFRIPLKPHSFDIVLDYGIFHHIRRRDTEAYLKLLENMIADGGYLLLSCFSTDFKHANGKKYRRGFVVHKNHYDRFTTKPELRRLFGKHFRILKIEKDKEGFLHALMAR